MGTDFFMIPGDVVSYKGERWLLLDTTGSPNQPMTARIRQATHADAVAEKVVRYDTLKPLASMREQHLYQLELEVNMSNFIFYMKVIPMDGKLRDMVCSGNVRGRSYLIVEDYSTEGDHYAGRDLAFVGPRGSHRTAYPIRGRTTMSHSTAARHTALLIAQV